MAELIAGAISASLALGVLLGNVLATVLLVRSGLYTRPQKIAQGVLLWVLPLFFVVVVLVWRRARQLERPGAVDEEPTSAGPAAESALPLEAAYHYVEGGFTHEQ